MAHHLTGRMFWVQTLRSIADKPLHIAADRHIHDQMPMEGEDEHLEERMKFRSLEMVGRLLAGLAPWLELQDVPEAERELQARYRILAVKAIEAIVDPESPDRMKFEYGQQTIVDAAFLAEALLRAPTQLADKIEPGIKKQLINDFKGLRDRKPYFNNWLLFAAMTEVWLDTQNEDWDMMRVDYAIRQHLQWYKGDGIYGDGPDFHWDYYNSFVIQPMMLTIAEHVKAFQWEFGCDFENLINRSKRYAQVLERLINVDGTYPVIGRSLAYRFGAFHHLAYMSYKGWLHAEITPAQVRCALEEVIRRTTNNATMFDENGWLTIGLYGHQPGLGERYISTASTYLCSEVFLPLGLPAKDPFWAGPETPWTARKVWGGADFPKDHAYRE